MNQGPRGDEAGREIVGQRGLNQCFFTGPVSTSGTNSGVGAGAAVSSSTARSRAG
jgi:hypothetical protein